LSRLWRKLVVGAVLVLALLVTLPVAAVYWCAASPSGTAWLLSQLARVGVVATAPQGSLLGDFSAESLVIDTPRSRIEISAPQWRSLTLGYARYPGAWLVIRARLVQADRVVVSAKEAGPRKAAARPTSIRLPFELEVDEVVVGELRLPGLPSAAFWDVHGRVHLNAAQGSLHQFDALRAGFAALQIQGHAHIATRGGLALDVAARALQAQDKAGPGITVPAWSQALRRGWQAELLATGPLDNFKVTTSLQAQGQALSGKAEVTPFAPWPLPALELQTQGLDLSALLPSAPATKLSGQVSIAALDPAQGAAGGLKWVGALSNAQPGPWSQQQLPVRSAKFELRAAANFSAPLRLPMWEVVLANGAQAAGTLRGSALWDRAQFSLDAKVSQLQTQALDARLPAFKLSGPISLSSRCSPQAPAQAWGAFLCKALANSAPTFDLQADLEGELGGQSSRSERAVALKLDASGSPQKIEVHEFLARTGGATATLSGTAQQRAKVWELQTKAALVDFDPRVWLSAQQYPALAAGPHRLNLQSEAKLQLTPGSHRDPVLQQLRGQAAVQWQHSMLAGVPTSGQITLERSASNAALQASAQVEMGGNSAKLEGTLDPAQPAQDRWKLETKVPQLAQLVPALKLLPSLAGLSQLSGAFSADAQLTGRWPDAALQGQAQVQELKTSALTLAKTEANWQLSTQPSAPLLARITLTQATWAGQRLGASELQIKGTLQDHTVSLKSQIKAAPPAWMQSLQGRASTALGASLDSTEAVLQASGQLSGGILSKRAPTPNAPAPLAWRGTVQQLELRNANRRDQPWISTRDVALEMVGGSMPKLSVSAGRADIVSAGLRWERIEWQPPSAQQPQQLQLQAELEPFAVPALLQRLQPEFGWGGDLKIGGKLNIQQGQRFAADMSLERLSGDLSVTDETSTQALGLSDLVFALSAHDGVWNFTQGLAGKQLGAAVGAFVVRTSAQRAWPAPGDALQGVLQAQVDNLGIWGAWVPAGWRLGGKVNTAASVGGSFGAPQYTGQLQGQGITVRNLLEGVNLQNGAIDIALQGDTARIHELSASAGEGTVRLSGKAELGAAPRAELALVADRFQLLGRIDRRIITSGQGQVLFDKDKLRVDGQLKIDEGLFDFTQSSAPTLGDDVVVTNQTRAEASTPEPGAAPSPTRNRNTHINLQFDLGDKLKLRGKGIDTGLQGQVNVTTPGGLPVWKGSIRAVNGTYAAYGQKLVIERGVITFTGPVADPRLDIHAARPNLDVEVGVAISGTAQNPRVRIYSEPEMSDVNKLSWLMLGRASEGLGTADAALLQRAALGLLAGDSPGITDRVLQSVGIDELSVRQSEGEARETLVSLGKQLSRRLYVGYERGLNTTTGTWQLIYRIAQRFTLRGQQGRDNSLDVIWTWRWH
jgi:translocation and assembly module TamB